METEATNSSEGFEPTGSKAPRMNRAKAAAVTAETRLRSVATWELTQGNRMMTNRAEIFKMAQAFRQQIECGEFKDLEELETVVFSRWGLKKKAAAVLEFAEVDPPSGG